MAIDRSQQTWPEGETVSLMKSGLCIEWREIGRHAWSYATGTRDKSRGELTRLLTAWQARNHQFEFRIRPFAIPVQ